MKKYNIIYLNKSMEDEGYKLLTNEYSSIKKMDYICNNGHKSAMIVNNWVKGRRCPSCKAIKIGNIKRMDFNIVKQSFQLEGFNLLSTEDNYKNNNTKLDYICSKGHKHSISWSHWQQGERCAYCCNKIPLSLLFIKNSFESCGYNITNKDYTSYDTLFYTCPKGHTHGMKWGHWQQGCRCPTCYGKNIKLTIEQVRNYFEQESYVLLSKEYINNNTKLYYKCPEGHEHSIVWRGWKQGQRCPTCAYIKFSGAGHPNWKGGISYEPYCSIWGDKEYKKYIRDRDGNKCLNPACTKKDIVLHIHHIDYNKKNCSPSNLITVCRSCNTSANKDRDWHTTWYSAIIKNRYYSRSA